MGFIAYAVVYDVIHPQVSGLDCDTIEPQSMPMTTKEQNVTFVDEEPGKYDDYGSHLDSLRSEPMVRDASLEDFFSRPLRIGSTDWNVGATLNASYYPWDLYFKNSQVVNRIANYKILSAEMCVKVLINGNAFHYGRAILSYTPMMGYDDLTRTRALISADIVGLSQRPHVYIDPSTSQGGCIALPFTWWQNALDITSDSFDATGTTDFERIGRLDLKSLNELKHANGATDSATIDIFVWARNVKYAVPTAVEPADISPQSLSLLDYDDICPQADEYTGSGVVSKPAMAVANYLNKVKAPIIQPYITATALGAQCVGAIANLFGYSRPVMLEGKRYQLNTKQNMAVSNMEDDAAKLSVDAKQELTIDPSIYGLSTKDELDLLHIAQVESYLTTFTWPVAKSQEEMIGCVLVDPVVPVKYQTELHFPAITFASVPFNRWRGSIKYRFQVVCSKFHRGRIKVVYDPSATSSSANYNTAYTTIVDISNTTDFTVVAGWGQSTTYRKMNEIQNPMDDYIKNTPIIYDSNSYEFGNGVISIYVVNELTVPNSTINNDVAINVFISAGDDFEVAMPSGERVTRLRLRTAAEVPALLALDDIAPQSMEMTAASPAATSMGVPSDPTTVSVMAGVMPTTDPANLMHFGESIRSFRQLIKRYNAHEWISPWNQGAGYAPNGIRMLSVQRPALPFEPGYTPKANAGQADRVPSTVGGKQYAYGIMTLLRYVTTGYVGWRGSVRYMVDTGALGCGCTAMGPLSVGRFSECAPETKQEVLQEASSNAGRAQRMASYDDVSGQEGFIVQNTNVNPTVCFEVPYYSEKRFSPARSLTNFDLTGQNYGPCWKLRLPFYTGTATDDIKLGGAAVSTFVAAGEDFTCGFFIGAPVFFFEGVPPA